jgi:hypothetical protein
MENNKCFWFSWKNNIWNSKHASPEILKKREDYDKKMITLLERNVIESWKHFKGFLEQLK